MALVRWNTSDGSPITRGSNRDDLECFLDDFFRGYRSPDYRRSLHQVQSAFSPRFNVVNREGAFILTADLPGLDKEDIEITIENDVITIKGERKIDKLSENECFTCQESSYGVFERRLQLPEKVDSEGVTASLKNGVLALTLPKAEPRSSVKIQVN